MASVGQIMTAIKAAIRPVDGLRSVPDQPPDSLNVDPIAVVYDMSGTWRHAVHRGATQPKADGQHTIAVEIAVPRKDLARDMARLEPFLDSIPQALFSAYYRTKFDDTVVLLNEITVSLLRPDQQQSGLIGYTFAVNVTCEEEIVIVTEVTP